MGFTSKQPTLIDSANDNWSKGFVTIETNKDNHEFYNTLLKTIHSAVDKYKRQEIVLSDLQKAITEEVNNTIKFVEKLNKK